MMKWGQICFIKTYYSLIKPGIVFGNIITTFGGFALASKSHIDYQLLLLTLAGLFLVMGSACVFNNFIDRHIDQKMKRTKNRALVKGLITEQNALIFASFLVLLGIAILAIYTNLITLSVALFGFFVYVFLYSFCKKRSVYATLIGSFAGAAPPVVGYCAVSNNFDLGALLLFMILVFWQMPHFYAIAIYRFDDYQLSSIPVLPIKKGMYVTKMHMLLYIIAFIIMAFLLTMFGFMGQMFLFIVAVIGFTWLYLAIRGFKVDNDKLWARQMFALSIGVITLLSISISVCP